MHSYTYTRTHKISASNDCFHSQNVFEHKIIFVLQTDR